MNESGDESEDESEVNGLPDWEGPRAASQQQNTKQSMPFHSPMQSEDSVQRLLFMTEDTEKSSHMSSRTRRTRERK